MSQFIHNGMTNYAQQFINQAERFATIAHLGQTYNGGPYIEHPKAVVGVLYEYGIVSHIIIAAGWLHDTVEDTDVNVNTIADKFGAQVADIVERVTDKLPGRPRVERHMATYPRLAEVYEARVVKLADRIANMRVGRALNSDKYHRYITEHAAFKGYLWQPAHMAYVERVMWSELEKLNTLPKAA